MRTYVRADARRRSCTRTSTPSTRRSSSETIPRLRGRPVIVGGGVVLAASYEAKACGVRTAMGGGRPAGCARDAVVVRPRMSAYSEASKAVFEVFEQTTPLVEGLSIDEAFLDVRGLRAARGHADRDRRAAAARRARARSACRSRSGVARTKFLAKVASGVAKPDGLLVVPPDRRARLPASAPGRAALGRGPRDRGEAARPRDRHRRRGRRARRGRRWSSMLGRALGRQLHALAHNRDPRPVRGRPAPALDRLAAGARPLADDRPRTIDTVLVGLVDRVTRRMRTAQTRRPHGRAAPALRRLLARDPLAHAAVRDRADARRSSPPRASCSSTADADDRARRA